MPTRGLVAIFLALGLVSPLPFAVLADEDLQVEIIEIVEDAGLIPGDETLEPLETVQDPIPEESAPALIEVAEAPEGEEMLSTFSAESEEEQELIWGCEMQLDGEGNEFERCGLGYYRTLCIQGEGPDECITFFEFYEEPYDYWQEELDGLNVYKLFNLSLSWNGTALNPDAPTLPTGTTGTLGWSYVYESNEQTDSRYRVFGGFSRLRNESSLTLLVYRGVMGEGELVYSEPIADTGSGETSLSLSEPGEYHVIIAANTPEEVVECGDGVGGDICPSFYAPLESFEWYMERARSCYIDPDYSPLYCYDRDDPDYQPYGRTYPVAFGEVEIEAGETSSEVSNVLFLPGIKGSRLYRESDERLWDPPRKSVLEDLYLLADGRSMRTDIYAKEGDIVDEVLGRNFYASFVNQMNALKSGGTLTDWRAVAYDWRLSLDDIVSKGARVGDRIYFHEETETPYIEETLRELAASSPTGKVSIVAHSNGGLVTKKLMQRLEAGGDADLVDKIILVGVPQSGAPQAMGALLYGYGEALPFDGCSDRFFTGWLCAILASRDMARSLAEYSPMAYHLLPSQAYFEQVTDTAHPVAKFTASTVYAEERTRYGNSIDTVQELYDFLVAADGGRVKPSASDTAKANVLNSSLIEYAEDAHQELDAWTPPEDVEVYQVAGWGVNTIAGVEFYEQKQLFGGYKEMYRPMFVEDGDGVVPIPSSLLMGEVDNYWIDLLRGSAAGRLNIDHGNIFEFDELRVLIRDLLLDSISVLPEHITTTQPSSEGGNKLIFYLHSPLSMELKDDEGNVLTEQDGVEYGEFGEVKYLIAPTDEYRLELDGEGEGTFSLDVQKLSGDGVVSSVTFADVPVTESTVAAIDVSGDLTELGNLQVDLEGDAEFEIQLEPSTDNTVLYTPAQSTEVEEAEDEDDDGSSGSSVARTPVTTSSTQAMAFPSPTPTQPFVAQTAVPTTRPALYQQPALVSNPAIPSQLSSNVEEPISLDERTASPRLTASAYDSVDAGFLKQIGDVLYNMGQVFLTFVAHIAALF